MAKETGGSAFPDSVAVSSCGDLYGYTGMTLRDYFAAKAMVRLTGADPDGIHSAQMLAQLSYRLADAMIAERAK